MTNALTLSGDSTIGVSFKRVCVSLPPSPSIMLVIYFFDYNRIQISQTVLYKPKRWETVIDPGHLIETS